MKIDLLKNEAKRLGLRVTKKIKGKRFPLSEKELKMKIQRRRQPSLEIQVRESKKLLRTCKSLLRTVETNVPRVRRVSRAPPVPQASRAPPVPPPPPVPTRRDPRANLMTALKANLKRRGLREKINQTS
jgi:phage gp29-like protein